MPPNRFVPVAAAFIALALAGASFAQPLLSADATVEHPLGRVHVEAEVETPEEVELPALPDARPPAPAFTLSIHPASQETTPGGTVAFEVRVEAREARTLELALTNATRSFSASLDNATLTVAANGTANTTLRVTAPMADNATGLFEVEAVAQEDGERHGAKAQVNVRPPPPPPRAFTLTVSPSHQNATTGETVQYVIHAESYRPVRIELKATGPDGFALGLTPSVIQLGANETAKAVLSVEILTQNATMAWFNVNGTDTYSGYAQGATVSLSVRESSAPTPSPTPPGNETASPSPSSPQDNSTAPPTNSTYESGGNSTAEPHDGPIAEDDGSVVSERRGVTGPGVRFEASVEVRTV